MSTPGRRRALRALAARRRANLRRVARGQAPLVKDPKTGKLRKASAASLGLTKAKAKKRLAAARRRKRRR